MNNIIIIIISFFLIASCNQKYEGYDSVIKKPNDIKKIDQIESMLTVTPEKASLNPDYQVIEKISVPYVPEYRIGPGDVIEIVYHIGYDKIPESYHLDVQDKISILFPFHPQFSTTVLVRTDGKITVPLLGDISVIYKSPAEVSTFLNKEYGRYLINPSITIALEEFNVKIDEMKKVITTAPRGQSKIAPVTPDGRVSFPIIGTLQAQGFTIIQLEKLVNEKYSKFISSLNATLILLEIHHPKIYLFGEVHRPGAYEIGHQTNILNAIAMAGNYTKTSCLKKVVLFRNDGLERPVAYKIDLETALKSGNASAFLNLMLRPADVIYIPTSETENFLDALHKIFTRGIYTVLPFTSSFSWGEYDIGGKPSSGTVNK